MGKFKRVLVMEVEEAKDKNAETAGGKYRKDTPWLVESFKKKGRFKDILSFTFFLQFFKFYEIIYFILYKMYN